MALSTWPMLNSCVCLCLWNVEKVLFGICSKCVTVGLGLAVRRVIRGWEDGEWRMQRSKLLLAFRTLSREEEGSCLWKDQLWPWSFGGGGDERARFTGHWTHMGQY